MRFLLIISHDDAFRPTPDLIGRIHTWVDDASRRGIRIDGNPLQPADTATTVRIRAGALVRTEGPFSASCEQMCAYELVECADEEEAIRIAAAHPMASAATIEVRRVWDDLGR